MAKMKSQPGQQLDRQAGFVTIRIPIGDLVDGDGYQISKRNPPREIRQRRLSEAQGRALARIRLGMMSRCETLEADSLSGYQRIVDTKEDALCRLLELVYDATIEGAR